MSWRFVPQENNSGLNRSVRISNLLRQSLSRIIRNGLLQLVRLPLEDGKQISVVSVSLFYLPSSFYAPIFLLLLTLSSFCFCFYCRLSLWTAGCDLFRSKVSYISQFVYKFVHSFRFQMALRIRDRNISKSNSALFVFVQKWVKHRFL